MFEARPHMYRGKFVFWLVRHSPIAVKSSLRKIGATDIFFKATAGAEAVRSRSSRVSRTSIAGFVIALIGLNSHS